MTLLKRSRTLVNKKLEDKQRNESKRVTKKEKEKKKPDTNKE
jgi:hypothetical protein